LRPEHIMTLGGERKLVRYKKKVGHVFSIGHDTG